jgi:hypothetical protein
MGENSDYRIRLTGPNGLPIEDRSVEAESVTAAVRLAAEIAEALEAADFSITPLPPKIRGHGVR